MVCEKGKAQSPEFGETMFGLIDAIFGELGGHFSGTRGKILTQSRYKAGE